MTLVPGDSDVLTWRGAVSVEHSDSGSRAWRLPHDRIDLFHNADLALRASMQTGVRVAVATDATRITGRATIEDLDDPRFVDVVIDADVAVSAPVSSTGSFEVSDLPAGDKTVELWLPQFGEFWLHGLEFPSDARVWRAEAPPQPRIVTYGSSITHCRTAASPSTTWPALVARSLDLDLTSLGFGGQCHLDPLVAREITALRPDVITMCVGINIYGNGSFNARSFLPAILGFVATIRDTCPNVPVLLISPIASPPRETTPNHVGFTLVEMREHVAEAARLLRKYGDENVHYLDGLDVFPLSLADHLPDDLHPDAEGYAMMADAIAPVVKGILGGAR
jgi:lysophospholipase L1-like esterase